MFTKNGSETSFPKADDSIVELSLMMSRRQFESLEQRARAEGIQVGDEELRARIQGIRAFQENGRFSRDRYVSILTN